MLYERWCFTAAFPSSFILHCMSLFFLHVCFFLFLFWFFQFYSACVQYGSSVINPPYRSQIQASNSGNTMLEKQNYIDLNKFCFLLSKENRKAQSMHLSPKCFFCNCGHAKNMFLEFHQLPVCPAVTSCPCLWVVLLSEGQYRCSSGDLGSIPLDGPEEAL